MDPQAPMQEEQIKIKTAKISSSESLEFNRILSEKHVEETRQESFSPSEDERKIDGNALHISQLHSSLEDMKDQNRRDFDKLFSILQQETAKRAALEQRFHTQLLIQNEAMVAMELKLIRLETKLEPRDAAQKQQRAMTPRSNTPAVFQTINEDASERLTSAIQRPSNVFTSGASLASGVTDANSFIGDDVDESEKDTEDEVESQQSTPTFGSRAHNPIAGGNLESILQNPMLGEANPSAYSVRATRGDTDGNSSLGTAFTNTTVGSRSNNPIAGGNLESIMLNPMLGDANTSSQSVRATRGDSDGNSSFGTSVTNSTFTRTATTLASVTTRGDSIGGRFLALEPESRRGTSFLTEDNTSIPERRPSRSRSNSPLSVQSYAAASEASASQSTAIMSSIAIAAPRSRRALRSLEDSTPSTPLANRVVTFTTDSFPNQQQAAITVADSDSITMPDVLDNLSLSDAVASAPDTWRQEYEARLDALQKRYVNE